MLNLDPQETVILEVRKHWIVFISHAFFLFFSAIFPLVAYKFIHAYIPLNIPILNAGTLFLFLYFLWLLGIWISFFAQWTNYYLDVWYVTEKRIIDVEQKRPFHREISSIRFDKIQDITVEVRGVVATFLNYGDVRVQTASESAGDFEMTTAAYPERIRQKIFSQHNNQAERTQPVKIVDSDGDGRPDVIS